MDNKAAYKSSWDIDQVILEDEVSIAVAAGASGAPVSATYSVPVTNIAYPVVDAKFQGQGMTVWHEAGLDITSWDLYYPVGPDFVPVAPSLTTTNGTSLLYRVFSDRVDFIVLNEYVAQTVKLRYRIIGDTLVW